MKTFQLLTIKVIVFFNFFYPVYSSPNSFREVKYYSNPNDSSDILCTLKKECPDDPNTTCIPHGFFNTFTYDNSGSTG